MEKELYQAANEACLSSQSHLFHAALQTLRSCNHLTVGKLLGRGSRSYVYELPQLHHYVLQTKNLISEYLEAQTDSFEPVACRIPELNIGQAVLKSVDGQFCLLRRQIGVTYTIPFARFFDEYGIDALLGHNQPLEEKDTAPYRKEYALHLEKIARMPQKAYDKLVQRIQLIKQKGLYLDPCSLNILLDEATSSFNTLDHFEPIGPYENVLGLACALMDTMYVYLDEHAIGLKKTAFSNTVANEPTLIFFRQQILIKLLMAASKSGLSLPEQACPKNYFGFHQKSFDMNYVLRISGCKIDFSQLQTLWESEPVILFSRIAA